MTYICDSVFGFTNQAAYFAAIYILLSGYYNIWSCCVCVNCHLQPDLVYGLPFFDFTSCPCKQVADEQIRLRKPTFCSTTRRHNPGTPIHIACLLACLLNVCCPSTCIAGCLLYCSSIMLLHKAAHPSIGDWANCDFVVLCSCATTRLLLSCHNPL